MIKILVVEDEFNSREGIVSLINQFSDSYEVFQAQNGQEGLALTLEVHPDIIITDINMPIMDGLNMLKELSASNINIPSVILSGYSEFEYARRAISLGVEEYLLKPIMPDDLFSVINRLVEKSAKEKNVNNFTNLKELETKEAREHLEKHLKSGSDTPFDMVVLYLGNDFIDQKAYTLSLIKNTFLQYKVTGVTLFTPDEHILCIISKTNNHSQSNRLLFQQIVTSIPKSVAIYSKIYTLDNLSDEFLKLSNSINWSISLNKNLVDISETITDQTNVVTLEASFKKKADKLFSLGEYDECLKILKDYILSLSNKKADPMSILRNILNFLVDLHNESYNNLTIKNRSTKIEKLNKILKARTITELFDTLEEYFIYVKQFNHQDRKYSQIVSRAVEIIEKEYSNPQISQQYISDSLKITPQYLSHIFAQETNYNFTSYLINVRIEKAKQLLLNTDMKIFEISLEVGYPDSRYFCTLFKRLTGVSPNQYKNMQQTNYL